MPSNLSGSQQILLRQRQEVGQFDIDAGQLLRQDFCHAGRNASGHARIQKQQAAAASAARRQHGVHTAASVLDSGDRACDDWGSDALLDSPHAEHRQQCADRLVAGRVSRVSRHHGELAE